MQIKKTSIAIVLIAGVVALQNCSKSDSGTTTVITTTGGSSITDVLNLPTTPYNYSNQPFPLHIANALTAVDNMPTSNPITDHGATLGRVLFYDKNLSKNNTISCASCHKQEIGFTDNAQLSRGFEGGLTGRTSMSLLNLRFYQSGKMFWNERAATLEAQVLMPIQDHTEMGMTLTELVTKLKGLSYYGELFTKAFGNSDVDADKISRSLSQFLRSIVTYQAKYDRVKQGIETFTPDEAAGEQLFLTAGPTPCGGCHRPPEFITSNPQGPFALLDPNDAGIDNQNRFKSGSLRNIAITTNLFHNGSVTNVQTMLGSTIPLHGVPPPDRARLLAFIQTLTDNSVTTDVKFSNPFK